MDKHSEKLLSECHPDFQRLFEEVGKTFPFAVICGHRNQKDQDLAYRLGRTQLKYPGSKHNKIPSEAVDAVPTPIDWTDQMKFYHFVGYVRGVAAQLKIAIRSGADWDNDFNLRDQNFFDLSHFELIE